MAANTWLVIPDLDIYQTVFDRREINGTVVSQFQDVVKQRRLLMVGWIRPQFLARTTDDRNRSLLQRGLSGFVDMHITTDDHIAAATLSHKLRPMGGPTGPFALLLWAVAERFQASIWSRDRDWHRYRSFGCPVITSASVGP